MNSTDAYLLLEVEESATSGQIKEAYHRLALTCHPDRLQNENDDTDHFLKVKEAYQLLMFVKELGEKENSAIQQLPPNEYELKLTLEETFIGCVKYQTITRSVIDADGVETKEEVELTVKVKPGSLSGSKIILENAGNSQYGKLQADVVFTITELPHKIFKRHRFNLFCAIQVHFEDVILGSEAIIPMLTDEEVIVQIDEGLLQDNTRRIKNRGFPVPNCSGSRGDLVVEFNIIFDNEPDNADFADCFKAIDLVSDSE